MKIDLNNTDRKILKEIRDNGRGTVTLFANKFDKSRPYTRERVKRLWEHGFLEEVAPNLYDLTDKGDSALRED